MHKFIKLLLMGGLSFSSLTLYAGNEQSVPKMKSEINTKSKDLNKVQDELARRKREKEDLNRETKELSTVLKKSDAQIKDIERTLVHTMQRNASIEQDVATTKNRRDQFVRDITNKKTAAQQSFISYYVASALAGPSDLWAISLRQQTSKNIDETKQLHSMKEAEDTKYDELTLTYQALQSVVQNQTQALEEARYGKADKEKLLQKKLTRHQIVENQVAELEKTASELESLIDLLRTKAKKKSEEEKLLRVQKVAEGHSPIGRASLPWPVKGRVVQGFGRQEQGDMAVPFISNGLIIQPKVPSKVLAVASGSVLYVGKFMSYGPMVVVEHADDWYSVYGRLETWSVEKGQSLQSGQEIGSSGLNDKGVPEAYFELRFYGKPVDPRPWLVAP